MKLVNYRTCQEVRVGVFMQGKVHDVARLDAFERVRRVEQLLSGGMLEALEERAGQLLRESSSRK